MTTEQVLAILRSKFTSGNDVPITRAFITRVEYEAIVAALEQATGASE